VIKEQNAVIERTMLGIEDHGFLSFWLYLDYGKGVHQGAGGYALDHVSWPNKNNPPERLYLSIRLITKILETVGVEKWEDLPGTNIRVKADNVHVEAIAHILKDNWLHFHDFPAFFRPATDAKEKEDE